MRQFWNKEQEHMSEPLRIPHGARIVVADAHRGGGLARLFYEDLFRRARDAGQDRVVCEVNLDPPNPASDAFHAKMGFTEIGRATLARNGKTVRYLAKHLAGEAT